MNAKTIGRIDSLEQFIDEAFAPRYNLNTVNSFAQENRGDWYGPNLPRSFTAGNVKALIHDGWNVGAERIARFAAGLEVPVLANVRRRNVWSDQGDEIDMQRVYNGNLENAWRRVKRTLSGQTPRVCIAVDSIASGGKPAEQMFWQGAAAAALADVLVAAGYTVKCISGFRGNYYAGAHVDVQVIVKDYSSGYSLADMASALALPGFFRAIGHMWAAGHTASPVRGVGMNVLSLSLSDVDAPEAQKVFLAPQSLNSEGAAKAWLLSVIADLERDKAEGR